MVMLQYDTVMPGLLLFAPYLLLYSGGVSDFFWISGVWVSFWCFQLSSIFDLAALCFRWVSSEAVGTDDYLPQIVCSCRL